jgi:putative transcriptional regulator
VSENLTGRVLIAMPGIGDARFDHAVILICAHDDRHAVGLTMNQPAEGLTLPGLLRRLSLEPDASLTEDPVLVGGPVERERGFVVHTDDYMSRGSSLSVCEGVAWTATREALAALCDRMGRPRRATLALGYAGWSAGQIEREIQDNAWLICDPDESLLFDTDHDLKWARALAKLGVAAGNLSAQSGRA